MIRNYRYFPQINSGTVHSYAFRNHYRKTASKISEKYFLPTARQGRQVTVFILCTGHSVRYHVCKKRKIIQSVRTRVALKLWPCNWWNITHGLKVGTRGSRRYWPRYMVAQSGKLFTIISYQQPTNFIKFCMKDVNINAVYTHLKHCIIPRDY